MRRRSGRYGLARHGRPRRVDLRSSSVCATSRRSDNEISPRGLLKSGKIPKESTKVILSSIRSGLRTYVDSDFQSHRICLRFAPMIVVPAICVLVFLTSCVSPPSVDPTETTRRMPAQSADAHGLIVIIHGAFGGANTWSRGVERAIRSNYDTFGWDFVRVNWLELSSRYMTAMASGRRLGRELGKQLATPEFEYKTIHLIAASLGSHVAEGITRGYVRSFSDSQSRAFVHATYLEPFGGRRWRFGAYADFAEHYFTATDPFPFTNGPLPNAFNFEVSALVPPKNDPAFWYFHDFPVLDYRKSIGDLSPGFSLSPLALQSVGVDPAKLKDLLPRGEVRVLRPNLSAER